MEPEVLKGWVTALQHYTCMLVSNAGVMVTVSPSELLTPGVPPSSCLVKTSTCFITTSSILNIQDRALCRWQAQWMEAKTSLEDRDGKMAAVAELVEVKLRLLGCTAIEDKLQVRVTVYSLRRSGGFEGRGFRWW